MPAEYHNFAEPTKSLFLWLLDLMAEVVTNEANNKMSAKVSSPTDHDNPDNPNNPNSPNNPNDPTTSILTHLPLSPLPFSLNLSPSYPLSPSQPLSHLLEHVDRPIA